MTTEAKIKNPARKLAAAAFLVLPLVVPGLAAAEPFDHDHHRFVEVHRDFPHGYRHVIVPRDRFYRGVHIVRFYGPRYPGFGFFYDDAAAWAFLGLTTWELSNYNMLREEQLRAQEAAMVEATTAPVNDPITWSDEGATGSVTAVRDGHTEDGRVCREFQQQVTVDGQAQQSYGTACQQPDGSWKIVQS